MDAAAPLNQEARSVEYTCPVCESETLLLFLSIDRMPVQIGVLWETRDDALVCPTGRIDLCYCNHCGFVSNMSFSPSLLQYVEGYDNTLTFSPVFQEYSRALALDLIDRYDLHGKHVVEIGSGRGDFLRLICQLGDNQGVGFDPSYRPDGDEMEASNVKLIQDTFSDRYRDYPADLIICRQVFEHIVHPRAFLSALRSSIGPRRIPVFFEVPDLRNILEQFSIWAIIYEHCSYFTSESLQAVFSKCGFEVLETPRLYQDQFVGVHATPATGVTFANRDLKELDGYVRSFHGVFHRMLADWRSRFDDMRREGRRVVVWGAGARGASFMNLLDTRLQIEHVVDINPRKKGKFIAGTGQEIVDPPQLRKIRPDAIIVMNPIYVDEVREATHALGISPELLAA